MKIKASLYYENMLNLFLKNKQEIKEFLKNKARSEQKMWEAKMLIRYHWDTNNWKGGKKFMFHNRPYILASTFVNIFHIFLVQ